MLKMYDTLFNAAAFAGMTRKQQEDYMSWWRIRQDNYNADRRAKRIAREEGLAEGLKEGREKGLAEGREKGLAEGRAEGRAEGAREQAAIIATRMMELGLSEETIEQSTGLSASEIKSLTK